ncbi:MAG: MBL fold metallo-hydrolase [bacterium]
MKVKMLGTGAVYTIYNSASVLVDEKIIIDTPNGALKQFLRNGNDINKIETIIITHMHGDHTADILFFLVYINIYLRLNKKINIIGPVGISSKIIEIENAFNFIKQGDYLEKYNIKITELADEEEVIVHDYKIKAYKVLHGKEEPCNGYVINNKLGVTGDATLCQGVEKIVENSKVIITDCSHINESKTHMGIDTNKILYEKYKKQMVATHIRDLTREYAKDNNIDFMVFPEDYYEFTLD